MRNKLLLYTTFLFHYWIGAMGCGSENFIVGHVDSGTGSQTTDAYIDRNVKGRPRDRVAPSATADPTNMTAPTESSGVYTFTNVPGTGAQQVWYRIDTQAEDVQGGLIRVEARFDGVDWFTPLKDAGMRFREDLDDPTTEKTDEEVIVEPIARFQENRAVITGIKVEGPALELSYQEVISLPGGQTKTLNRVHRFEMMGSSLKITLRDSDATGLKDADYYYCGFSPGSSSGTMGVKDSLIPYCPFPSASFMSQRVAVSYGTYCDPLASTPLSFEPYISEYNPVTGALGVGTLSMAIEDTADKVSPHEEIAYLTVSNDIIDVLPRLFVHDEDPAPRASLSNKTYLDLFQQGSFAEDSGMQITWTVPNTMTGKLAVTALPFVTDFPGYLWSPQGHLRLEIRKNSELRYSKVYGPEDLGVLDNYVEQTITVHQGDVWTFAVGSAGRAQFDNMYIAPGFLPTDGSAITIPNDLDPILPSDWSFQQYFEGTEVGLSHYDPVANILFSATSVGGAKGYFGSPIEYGEYLSTLVVLPTAIFKATGQWIDRLESAGIEDIALIDHTWMQFGLDGNAPDQHPYNPRASLDAGQDWDDLFTTQWVSDSGVYIHENWGVLGPVVTDMAALGLPEYVWPYSHVDPIVDKDETPVGEDQQLISIHQSMAIQADEMSSALFPLANPPTGEWHGPKGIYIDAMTVGDPGGMLSMDADLDTYSKTGSLAWSKLLGLFEGVSEYYKVHTDNPHRVPILGEGKSNGQPNEMGHSSLFAGYEHGGARALLFGMSAYTLPDYELRVIRPHFVGQGMGSFLSYYYPTFAEDAPGGLRRREMQSIAYGHGGWLGGYDWKKTNDPDNPSVMPTLAELMERYADIYFPMKAAQAAILDPSNAVKSIEYLLPETGQRLSLDSLLASGLSPANAQITTTYVSGTTVKTNSSTGSPRWVSTAGFQVAGEQWSDWFCESKTVTPLTLQDWSPMVWDPLNKWNYAKSANGKITAFTSEAVMLSNTATRAARFFKAPVSGDYRVTVRARTKTSEFDGIRIEVIHGGESLASFDTVPIGGDPNLPPVSILGNVTISNVIKDDMIMIATDSLDSTAGDWPTFLTIEIEDVSAPAAPNWQLANGRVLPFSGFEIFDPASGSGASYALLSGAEAQEVIWANNPDFRYLKSLSGAPVEMEDVVKLKTDGGFAVVRIPTNGAAGMSDLHLFNGTRGYRLDLSSTEPALELSERSHCHLNWKDETTFYIAVPHTSTNSSVEVTSRTLSFLGVSPSVVTLTEQSGRGFATSIQQFTYDQGVLTFLARPGYSYVVSWAN